MNSFHDSVRFKLLETVGGDGWALLAHIGEKALSGEAHLAFGAKYEVEGRSVIVFELKAPRHAI